MEVQKIIGALFWVQKPNENQIKSVPILWPILTLIFLIGLTVSGGTAAGGGFWAYAIGTIGHSGPMTLIIGGSVMATFLFVIGMIHLILNSYRTLKYQKNVREIDANDNENNPGRIKLKPERIKLKKDRIFHAPKEIKVETKVDLKHINLKKFIEIWEKVGRSHLQYEAIKADLTDWITNQIGDSTKYTHIPAKSVNEARIQLENYLRSIIDHFDHSDVDDSIKERIILRLVDASKVCSPTWIEVARKEYTYLINGLDTESDYEQILLEYVQSAKEDWILSIIARMYPDAHWNGLNYVRWLIGKQLGLAPGVYDSTVSEEIIEGLPAEACLQIFYTQFTGEELIRRVTAKICLDNDHPKSNGLDQRLTTILEICGNKLAAINREDIASDDFDIAMFCLNNFYNLIGTNKYQINELAVEFMLSELGIIEDNLSSKNS